MLPVLSDRMNDPSVAVRDSAAWVIGRVCELMPQTILHEQFLNTIATTLINNLTAEPRVAANVCWVCTLFFFLCCHNENSSKSTLRI